VISKWVLVIVSFAVSVLVAEGITRLVFHPVDLLQPTIERDLLLNHRIASGTGGHDDRGFRNYETLRRAEIVAIGDSMTYGVAATSLMSWPQQLARLHGVSVYNMSLGGYGPLHYMYLLKQYAIDLEPSVVLVGLYLGNDFMDSYNLAYSNEQWIDYRIASVSAEVDSDNLVSIPAQRGKLFGEFRHLLSRNSVLYALLTRSALGDMVRSSEIQKLGSQVAQVETVKGITYVDLDKYHVGVDIMDSGIQEGLRLSLLAIDEIAAIANQSKIQLIIAVIPTKASVYAAELIQSNTDEDRQISISLQNEQMMRQEIFAHFKKNGISWVDLLPPLKIEAGKSQIYPPDDDHPNANGYAVIAEQLIKHVGFEPQHLLN